MRFLATIGVLTLLAGQSFADTAHWRIKGDLSESCSCSVPCSCNFGEAPSPNHFCWAVFSLDIKEGNYGGTSLNGLKLAGALGGKGSVWYIDERATPAEAAALKVIARKMSLSALQANGIKSMDKAPPDMKLRGFKTGAIEQEVGPKSVHLKIAGAGGFDAKYIMGLDGKTPVIVENNYSWNITKGIKAKSKVLAYHDSFGNKYEFKGVNANQGQFD